MEEVKLSEFITENYSTYGNYVNFNRVIVGLDGLKPVQRRILLALKDIAKGKLTGTVNAVGAAQVLHPFGNQSIESTIGNMARLGMIDGQGSFGVKLIEEVPAAAARYTKVGLTNQQYEYYFRLLNYCPVHDGEEQEEPKFLTIPIPVALVHGTLSWGLGVICRLPAFTYKSLIEAYFSNDYTKLESSFGYILDKDNSDLKELWNTGKGRLTLAYEVKRINYDNILIYGSGEIFTPRLGGLNELVDNGQIIINNESTDQVIIKISRVKGARLVDMDEVFEQVKKFAVNSRIYEIKLVYNDKIVNLGIKDWLDVTISNFKKKFEQYKTDRIAKLNSDIDLYRILPSIGKMVLEDMTNAQIAKKLKVDIDLVNRGTSKSISMLRRESFETEINSLTDKISMIEQENSVEFIKNQTI